MTEARQRSIVEWSTRAGGLLDQDGSPVTNAQEKIARHIIERGLLSFTRTLHRDAGLHLLNEWHCAPKSGAKQSHTLTVEESRDAGPTRRVFNCDCQAARGTAKSPPRRCSHMLALQWLLAPNEHDGERDL